MKIIKTSQGSESMKGYSTIDKIQKTKAEAEQIMVRLEQNKVNDLWELLESLEKSGAISGEVMQKFDSIINNVGDASHAASLFLKYSILSIYGILKEFRTESEWKQILRRSNESDPYDYEPVSSQGPRED